MKSLYTLKSEVKSIIENYSEFLKEQVSALEDLDSALDKANIEHSFKIITFDDMSIYAKPEVECYIQIKNESYSVFVNKLNDHTVFTLFNDSVTDYIKDETIERIVDFFKK